MSAFCELQQTATRDYEARDGVADSTGVTYFVIQWCITAKGCLVRLAQGTGVVQREAWTVKESVHRLVARTLEKIKQFSTVLKLNCLSKYKLNKGPREKKINHLRTSSIIQRLTDKLNERVPLSRSVKPRDFRGIRIDIGDERFFTGSSVRAPLIERPIG